MMLGRSILGGGVPLGVAEDIFLATAIQTEATSIVISSSTTLRIGSALAPSAATITIAGATGAVVSTVFQVEAGAIVLTASGTVSLGMALAVTGAAVTLSGGEPAFGTGVAPVAVEIVLTGGDPVFGSQIGTTAASIVLTGGVPHVGFGLTLGAGEFSLTGGAPILATTLKPGFATLWFSGGVMPEITEAAEGTVVVLNANTLAASEYGIAALDVLEHKGEVYFVTATGLVKLAAGAAGVAGSITTGDLELADGSLSLNLARFEMKADGELHLTATAHQDGGQRSVRYLVSTRAGANDRNRNVKLGNGVLGNAWSFTIAPPAGEACNWSLGDWKIEPGQYKLRRK